MHYFEVAHAVSELRNNGCSKKRTYEQISDGSEEIEHRAIKRDNNPAKDNSDEANSGTEDPEVDSHEHRNLEKTIDWSLIDPLRKPSDIDCFFGDDEEWNGFEDEEIGKLSTLLEF